MKRSRSDASICNSTTGSSSSADAPTFAICTITKDPHRFERWLDYSRDLGASHVFLRVEKTPEVDALRKLPQRFEWLRAPPGADAAAKRAAWATFVKEAVVRREPKRARL